MKTLCWCQQHIKHSAVLSFFNDCTAECYILLFDSPTANVQLNSYFYRILREILCLRHMALLFAGSKTFNRISYSYIHISWHRLILQDCEFVDLFDSIWLHFVNCICARQQTPCNSQATSFLHPHSLTLSLIRRHSNAVSFISKMMKYGYIHSFEFVSLRRN